VSKRAISDTQQLRVFLTEKLTDLADGKIDITRINGIAKLSQQIYNTLNIELRIALAAPKLADKRVEPVKF
jgi:hypothetical protein